MPNLKTEPTFSEAVFSVSVKRKDWLAMLKYALVILLTCSASADYVSGDPIDPDPDGIGIYFDEGAGAGSWCASAPVGTLVTAYLCLTRAGDTSGFNSWEARIESSVAGALAGLDIRGGGTNSAIEPEFVVSYDTPLPWQTSTVLLDITVEVVWEWSIALRVWPASNPSGAEQLPAYTTVDAPDDFRTLGYSFSWDPQTKVPNWCASINDGNCLNGPSTQIEDSTWGGIKVLFR